MGKFFGRVIPSRWRVRSIAGRLGVASPAPAPSVVAWQTGAGFARAGSQPRRSLLLAGGDSEAAVVDRMPAAERPVLRVRAVAPADIEPLCRFLHRGFAADSSSPAAWRALFDYDWLADKPALGLVLVAKDEIVGFLGTVYAWREINGKAGLVCNFSSWFVCPGYRGWGFALVKAATRDKTISYTCLTPAPTSWRVLETMGFSKLYKTKILFPPLLHAGTLRGPRPSISFACETVRRSLTEPQRRLFDDHAAHDCLQVSLQDGPKHAFLIVKRRVLHRHRLERMLALKLGMPVSEILYCSAPELLARHLERVKLVILRKQRTLGLVADERLFRVPPRGISLREYTLFRSPLFDADELDRLYSELVLLPV